MKNQNGKLYIVATPIGNLGDITLRAIETLKNVDLILCEDSRVTNILLKHYHIDKPLMVYNDHSDERLREKIFALLKEGKNLSLVSDAGTPLISDPGYKLIEFLQQNEITIHTVPGACSAIAALTLAGIATNRFMFLGFLPSKTSGKEKIFTEVQSINSSLVFFESSNRLVETLRLIGNYFASRKIAVVREITKLYEEVMKGSYLEVIEYYQKNPDKLRGEIVLIIAPPEESKEFVEEEILDTLNKLMQEMSLKDAVEIASEQYPISKKIIYKLALKIK